MTKEVFEGHKTKTSFALQFIYTECRSILVPLSNCEEKKKASPSSLWVPDAVPSQSAIRTCRPPKNEGRQGRQQCLSCTSRAAAALAEPSASFVCGCVGGGCWWLSRATLTTVS